MAASPCLVPAAFPRGQPSAPRPDVPRSFPECLDSHKSRLAPLGTRLQSRPSARRGAGRGRGRRGGVFAEAGIVQFSQDDFSVERLLGTLGFMNVSSYAPPSMDDNVAAGYSVSDLSRLAGQDVGEGAVTIRIYRGRIVTPGPARGTRVILKAYPGRGSGSDVDADALSANELVTHAVLQQPPDGEEDGTWAACDNLCVLLGGFETALGEKWVVLRDDGFVTAADYARLASEATQGGRAVGVFNFFDRFDQQKPIKRREAFILELLRGALRGLAYMHSRGRLHQSLGPASIVLNTVDEQDVQFLLPRLRDFSFSVDISDPSVLSASFSRPVGAVEEGTCNLWRRAASVSATSVLDRRTFGIADDIYSAGLLVAFMAFVPLCPPGESGSRGSIDGPSLQRLLETTFRLDLRAAREYCAADERWANAVAFLDRNDSSGWELLQAMLNPDYRKRPSAASTVDHPFFLIG